MKSIYLFHNGILCEVCLTGWFNKFNWQNFKKGDEIFLDGKLFGYFSGVGVGGDSVTLSTTLDDI